MLYCALKPCLVMEKSVINMILSNVVLSPLTVTVNPGREPLSLSIILWPKMSVNSTKSQLNKKCIQVQLRMKILKFKLRNNFNSRSGFIVLNVKYENQNVKKNNVTVVSNVKRLTQVSQSHLISTLS